MEGDIYGRKAAARLLVIIAWSCVLSRATNCGVRSRHCIVIEGKEGGAAVLPCGAKRAVVWSKGGVTIAGKFSDSRYPKSPWQGVVTLVGGANLRINALDPGRDNGVFTCRSPTRKQSVTLKVRRIKLSTRHSTPRLPSTPLPNNIARLPSTSRLPSTPRLLPNIPRLPSTHQPPSTPLLGTQRPSAPFPTPPSHDVSWFVTGVAVGVLLVVCLVVFVCVLCWRRSKRVTPEKPSNDNYSDATYSSNLESMVFTVSTYERLSPASGGHLRPICHPAYGQSPLTQDAGLTVNRPRLDLPPVYEEIIA